MDIVGKAETRFEQQRLDRSATIRQCPIKGLPVDAGIGFVGSQVGSITIGFPDGNTDARAVLPTADMLDSYSQVQREMRCRFPVVKKIACGIVIEEVLRWVDVCLCES